jgi:hypothetical protein
LLLTLFGGDLGCGKLGKVAGRAGAACTQPHA